MLRKLLSLALLTLLITISYVIGVRAQGTIIVTAEMGSSYAEGSIHMQQVMPYPNTPVGLRTQLFDASGNFTYNLPAGGTWQFTFCNTSNVCFTAQAFINTTTDVTSNFTAAASGGGGSPPAGNTGDLQCKGSPSAFSACSQAPAPNDNFVVSSPSCSSVMVNCVFANWDAHYVYDATSTSTTTVTCPNSDCNFTGTDPLGRQIAKVGQIVFMTSNSLNGSLVCGQTTIASVDSATQIHITSACSSSVSATGVLVWGDDDTTNLNAAWAAAKCGTVQMPATPGGDTSPGGSANALFQSALFTTTPSCTTIATFQGPSLYGGSVTGTFLIATPNFNWSSCTGGASSVSCVGGVINGSYKQFTIWGGGYNTGGTSGKSEFQLNSGTRAQDVDIVGWCAECAGVVGAQHNSINGWFSEGGAIQAGTTACESTAIQTMWMGNDCDVAQQAGTVYAFRVLSGATSLTINNGYIPRGSSSATSFGMECDGTCVSMLDTLGYNPGMGTAGLGVGTNGRAYLFNTLDDVSGAASTTAIYETSTGGKVYLEGSTIKGGSSGQDIFMTDATDQIYDQGGNSFLGTTHVGNSGTGQIIGATSMTGTLLTAAKTVLSANFGTGAAISAVKGYNSPISFTITNGSSSTGASPTITYTFPTPYLVAPLFCNATQVGGTNATGTFSAGTPSATSVVFTYSLTPTASDTELVQVSCSVAQ